MKCCAHLAIVDWDNRFDLDNVCQFDTLKEEIYIYVCVYMHVHYKSLYHI